MNKILVTYATRAGSTFEVAVLVAEVLRTAGATVERMGQWLPEAVEFVKANRETLSHLTTAYFLVSGFLREDTPEMRQRALAYLDPVRKVLEPASIGLFAGKMDYSTMDWIDRSIAEAVSSAQGDWRNWEAIHNWAHDLSHLIVPQSNGASS